jgi:uncharacterized membrane protein YeaQ/YmgE (transglycosylase-associated protein family)
MATVIDELVVVLGLDTRKFTEGQRDALAAFKKTREGAEEFSKQVEEQGAKLSDIFGIVRKGALGIVGAFVGSEVAGFVNHIVTMDAATGRMATTIGTSVKNLSLWQYMVRQVGGDAGSASSALQTLQTKLENIRAGIEKPDPGLNWISSVTGFQVLGGRGNSDELLRRAQAYFAKEIGSGRMTTETAASRMQMIPGMNADMINLFLSDFQKIEAAAKAAGAATDENVKAAQKLQSTWANITQTIERWGANVITLFEKASTNEATQKDAEKVFGLGVQFRRDSPMDLLDRWMWGDYNMDNAKQKLREGLGGGGSGAGGSRGDRNNNPGNIKDGTFARAHGAVGSDGPFAVFPSYQAGSDAQIALVQSASYQGLTLHQFAKNYAEGSPAWEKTVGSQLGIGPNDIVNNMDPRLAGAIRMAEGTGARGSAAMRSGAGSRVSHSTSTVNINTMNINAPKATDAEGIAGRINGAFQSLKLTGPLEGGQH